MAEWLGTWKKRIKIAINHDKIPSDVVHFPLYLPLNSEMGLTCVFDEVGVNCKKIAITMADGVTQLYVEIDGWHYENEEAHLWFSREGWVILAESDTDIYLYYDNSQPDNILFVGNTWDDVVHNVWNEHYVAVYHMSDAGADPIPPPLAGASGFNPQKAIKTIIED